MFPASWVIALVRYKDQEVFAIYADAGPKTLLGEGSIKLIEALGGNPWNRDKTKIVRGIEFGVEYLAFPRSSETFGIPTTFDEIQKVGRKVFKATFDLAVENAPGGQNSDTFLELADTVNQSVPAQRLVEYKLQNSPSGNPSYWAIVDFNQPSTKKRFYLFDTKEKKIVQYYVAHGKGSEGTTDDAMADVFSNISGSNCSSLGIYRCDKPYQGGHGLSLLLDGLEDTNSNARARKIVLHNAIYVSDAHIAAHGRIGRSEGCFVVEKSVSETLINELKNGSYLIAWKQ